MKQYGTRSVYYAILAGGSGERLWPLSRRERPKQLLPFLHHESLLEQTVQRAHMLTDSQHIIVVTTTEYEEQIARLLGDSIGFIVAEPYARNTAAAIALAATLIYERDPQAILVILPADHYIPAPQLFASFMCHAVDYVQHHEQLTLLGVRPTYPETGYGYIEYEPMATYPTHVKHFYEKPSAADAQRYSAHPHMLWHTGIVAAQVSVFLHELERWVPVVYQAVSAYAQGMGSYEEVPVLSFDTAVLEQSARCTVLPVDLVWSDVGNLISYLAVQAQHKPLEGQVIALDAQRNLVNVKDSLVVLIDVNDICVVKTDDVLLIAHRDKTEKVKQVLDMLRNDQGYVYM